MSQVILSAIDNKYLLKVSGEFWYLLVEGLCSLIVSVFIIFQVAFILLAELVI
jgi:hypothetical protein